MLSDLFATPDFLIYDTCTRVLVWSSFWQETLLQEWAVRASWARKPTGPAVVHNGHRPLFTGLKNNLKKSSLLFYEYFVFRYVCAPFEEWILAETRDTVGPPGSRFPDGYEIFLGIETRSSRRAFSALKKMWFLEF